MNIYKSFRFSLAKKWSWSRPKKIGSRSNFKSAPAPQHCVLWIKNKQRPTWKEQKKIVML